METAEMFGLLFGCSLSVNGFFATYFLSGIKSQLKSMRKEMSEIKEAQFEQKERLNLSEYRLTALEADIKDLPCHNNQECNLKF